MAGDCIFCQIVAGSTTADVVDESETTLFFRDISPKAPVHIVAIPKPHISSLAAVRDADVGVLGQLLLGISQVAQKDGLAEDGYRVVSNVGRNAGQEVDHLHFHILGGESLGPLRC